MRSFFFVIAAMLLSLPSQAARHALVIGNDSYAHITPLKNARADARAMAKALEGAGFKVTLKTDLNEKGMTRAIREFREGVAGGDEVVLFYAGHGVQIGGANYLLPIDLSSESENQVRDDAVALQKVLDDLQEQKARFTLAIVDACRDNPFKGQGRNIGTRGLAPTSAADGQMIIFSAGAGQQALDRVGAADKSPNGLFTRVFVREIEKPGVAVHDALRNVRDEVVRQAKSVNHQQTPAIYDQSTGKFFFRRGTVLATAGGLGTAEDMPLPAVELPDTEAELWMAVRQSNTADDYAAYLAQYPNGKNAADAKRRLDHLRSSVQAAAAQQEKEAWAKAEKLASAEGFRAYLDAYPQGIYVALAQTRLKRLEAAGGNSAFGAPGKSFRDCNECPEMVNIPAGRFEMGSPSSEGGRFDNEGPVRSVSVPAFALGKFEVTVSQWAAFVRDTGFSNNDKCWTFASDKWELRGGNWRNPGYAQDDNHPVVCIDWTDAQAYVEWLARKTGKPYRLPSEAEWEYAARAGTTTARYWGDDADSACGFANVADSTAKAQLASASGWTALGSSGASAWTVHSCSDGMAHTAPVGRYRPNAFGLHDMIGNVLEWTGDCWNDSYNEAPTNGSAWTRGDCRRHVRVGGSWYSKPQNARSAIRIRNSAGDRDSVSGLRVALPISARTH